MSFVYFTTLKKSLFVQTVKNIINKYRGKKEDIILHRMTRKWYGTIKTMSNLCFLFSEKQNNFVVGQI